MVISFIKQTDEFLGDFQFLLIINEAAVNTLLHVLSKYTYSM